MTDDTSESQFEEGSCFHAKQGDLQTHALVSIAFSMKRIADALTYTPGEENFHDFVRDIRNNTIPPRR